ncbi:uncharacterized protein LOC129589356 [Paramacrobiotus metropolitanus]|uniref:uncharacterized protein LOC129589356 n=1 Tax=Paramacrobiotus metropolitanus TaxID=2943436 RepID=UPI0024465B05|nr:uncharacterized protein LOC129589356 [Paramacrobiotus metropolitanus]XP_055340051.1 uncharacterized protein LOC129589356 [Paramacrobiotus metropolitanus]XP_055340052.1 uncharacterized protein LOC129589356 [Paramacrobiotus metropolitanus]XP_055340053.1 uncharacterized protein LOC129589356 [Paramacrobiotus metropolitanus]
MDICGIRYMFSSVYAFLSCYVLFVTSQGFGGFGYPGMYGPVPGGGMGGSAGYNAGLYPQSTKDDNYAYAQSAAGSENKPQIAGRTELECNYDRNTGPMCKRSKLSPFMCHHNDNYPADSANYISENYGSTFKGLSVTEVDVWDVYDGPIGEDKDSICESDIELVRPGYAKTIKDQWRAVLQLPDVTQTVRVERCLRPNTPCRHVPGCYETNCKQRYSYVRLLVFDPCNKFTGPSYEMFRIPTACDCQMSPPKKNGGGGMFGVPGIPDFISNNPDVANSMKNVDGAGFANIPSSSGAGLSGRRR